jgi:hypothetical protein
LLRIYEWLTALTTIARRHPLRCRMQRCKRAVHELHANPCADGSTRARPARKWSRRGSIRVRYRPETNYVFPGPCPGFRSLGSATRASPRMTCSRGSRAEPVPVDRRNRCAGSQAPGGHRTGDAITRRFTGVVGCTHRSKPLAQARTTPAGREGGAGCSSRPAARPAHHSSQPLARPSRPEPPPSSP